MLRLFPDLIILGMWFVSVVFALFLLFPFIAHRSCMNLCCLHELAATWGSAVVDVVICRWTYFFSPSHC
jgi:hypothetical protein